MATWPADFGHPEVSPDASAPRACRLRVGIPLKWPLADVPWITTTRKSNAVRRPAPRRSWRRLPRRAHPIRHARGRGDGPHGGCRNGAPKRRAARSVSAPAAGRYPPTQLRHERAGCASASRRSGRSPTFPDHGAMVRDSSASTVHTMDAARLRAASIPIRTPAVAATDCGRRA
jgi:hypothetical protein